MLKSLGKLLGAGNTIHHHHSGGGGGGIIQFQGFVDSSSYTYRRPPVVKRARTASVASEKDIPLLADDVTTLYIDVSLSHKAGVRALERVPNTESIVFTDLYYHRRLTIDDLCQALDYLSALQRVDLRAWPLTEKVKDHLQNKYSHIRFRF